MLGFVAIGVSSDQTMSRPDLYGFGIHGQCARHFIQCQHVTLLQSIEVGTKGIVFLNPRDVPCREALSLSVHAILPNVRVSSSRSILLTTSEPVIDVSQILGGSGRA